MVREQLLEDAGEAPELRFGETAMEKKNRQLASIREELGLLLPNGSFSQGDFTPGNRDCLVKVRG